MAELDRLIVKELSKMLGTTVNAKTEDTVKALGEVKNKPLEESSIKGLMSR